MHMSLARKLFLLAAMTLTALAVTASSASAQIEVSNEATAEHCSAVTLMPNHTVEGGCHVDFVSPPGTDIPLHAYIPAKTTISNCEVELEGRVGENGEGYVTEAHLEPPHGGPVPCTRVACDEADDHSMIPWPFYIREHGPAGEEVEMTFCIRDLKAGEGEPGVECELHLEFTGRGAHRYEIGHATETLCENNPPNNPTTHPTVPAPVSFEVHLISGLERVEVVH
jgi:hypothetical protein